MYVFKTHFSLKNPINLEPWHKLQQKYVIKFFNSISKTIIQKTNPNVVILKNKNIMRIQDCDLMYINKFN